MKTLSDKINEKYSNDWRPGKEWEFDSETGMVGAPGSYKRHKFTMRDDAKFIEIRLDGANTISIYNDDDIDDIDGINDFDGELTADLAKLKVGQADYDKEGGVIYVRFR